MFNESVKNKLDILTNKNSKFLFYHYNDYLKQQKKEPIKVKHSLVTEDYLAAEKIQDRNWNYFVEKVLSLSENATVESSEQSFLLDTKENVVILKKTYESLYNKISKNFATTLIKMPFIFAKKVKNDLMRENFSESDFLELDTWVNFYFKQGRFPGNNDLTILPQTDLPPVVDQLSVEISPVDLYKKFGQGDTKCLTPFQGIVALFLNYGGDLNIAKKAMEEWKNNLTFQALSKENDKVFMNFSFLGELVFYFLQKFLLIEQEFLDFEKNQFEIANETIKNSEITTITSPKKFQSKVLIDDSNSLNEQESLFLKTSLTLSKTNLDASIEAAEEKNKKVIQEIIDPSPGFVIDEKFTDDDFSNREYGDKSKFKLNNAARQKFNNILKEINRDTKSFILPNRKYKLINESEDFTVEKEDFTVEKEESELEIQKSPLETKILNKKDQKRSPYNLRSFKRKIEHLKSEDKLNKPLIFEVEDKEIDKINAAEKILNSIINKAPDTATK